MPVPTIARISAYSAAEAPLWSRQRVLKKVMSLSPLLRRKRSGCSCTALRRGLCHLATPAVIAPLARQLGSSRRTCRQNDPKQDQVNRVKNIYIFQKLMVKFY
jgi:hypothetical protein